MHTHRRSTFTTGALLAQPPKLLRTWASTGHLAVDSETSAVFTAATAFGMRAASLQYVRDELPGRSGDDDADQPDRKVRTRASQAVLEVALALA